MSEVDRIRERYERRDHVRSGGRAGMLSLWSCLIDQELERALLRWAGRGGLAPLRDRRLLEVGCGDGNKLLLLLRLGFDAANLVGNELMPERAAAARRRLPTALRLLEGDLTQLAVEAESFDVVFQSLVFTSILDAGFRRQLAARMWLLVKPNGGVLWYDFRYNNPRNRDVRRVTMAELRALFPEARVAACWRLTLAPPLARLAARLHPGLYGVWNAFPFLRTHVLCWLKKGE
jgi:SAM-dependent methyltransferase